MPSFNIVDHGCTSLDVDTCRKSSKCSLVKNKCYEPALTVKDENNTYVIDTGSQETILGKNHEMCSQANHAHKHYELIQHFGGSSVGIFNAEETCVLGVKYQPMCSIGTKQGKNIGTLNKLDHDGLVGTIDVTNKYESIVKRNDSHSIIMNELKPKIVTMDKAQGTFCIGDGCNESDSKGYPMHQMKKLNTPLRYPLVDINGKGHILDTGSTISGRLNENLCLVGYNDINYLHIDYDSNQLSFKLSNDNPCNF